MDPLTQTIALLRPRALLWKQLGATGDWAIRFPANRGVVFSLIAKGRCVFQAAGHGTLVFGEGDFLLMTCPPDWTLGATERSVPIDMDVTHASEGVRVAYIGDQSSGPTTLLLGGRFIFDDANAELLDGLLPALMAIRSDQDGATRLRNVLEMIGDEAKANRPGRNLLLDRLLEILLIETIRRDVTGPLDSRTGLVAGLADPQIARALRALHADLRRRWSVSDLAKLAGMSRSVFAERFCRIVGSPPFDYLLHWRMAVAKDALRHRGDTLAEIAEACGYQSVSAFSAAFARTVGQPPSDYAARGLKKRRSPARSNGQPRL